MFENRPTLPTRTPSSGDYVIFGYNTEVCEVGTVYHVQSEARTIELLLETQVFVKGQCIGKRSTPFGLARTDEDLQELLRLQHRFVLDSIRSGQLDLNRTETGGLRNLNLQCMGATREAGNLILRFQISCEGRPKPNVRLRCFLAEVDSVLASELISELVTREDGTVDLQFRQEPPSEAELQVEVDGEEHRTVRRFRLRQRG